MPEWIYNLYCYEYFQLDTVIQLGLNCERKKKRYPNRFTEEKATPPLHNLEYLDAIKAE